MSGLFHSTSSYPAPSTLIQNIGFPSSLMAKQYSPVCASHTFIWSPVDERCWMLIPWLNLLRTVRQLTCVFRYLFVHRLCFLWTYPPCSGVIRHITNLLALFWSNFCPVLFNNSTDLLSVLDFLILENFILSRCAYGEWECILVELSSLHLYVHSKMKLRRSGLWGKHFTCWTTLGANILPAEPSRRTTRDCLKVALSLHCR